MNRRISLFLILLISATIVVGCSSMQRQKVYSCPSCKVIVPATATICPNCGQRLMPMRSGATAGAARTPGAGTPPAVSQAPNSQTARKFPPVKVGALLEVTDSNHQRFTPFVSVEVFKYDQGKDDPIVCVDLGVADEAIFAGFGIRGLVPDAPNVGIFFFGMLDWSPTLKYRASIHKKKAHFCSGIGVTFGGF